MMAPTGQTGRSETQVKAAIVEYLTRIGAAVTVTHNGRRRPLKAGTLDVYATLRGRTVAVEVKSARGVLSPVQVVEVERLRRAGAVVVVARDVEEVAVAIKAAGI